MRCKKSLRVCKREGSHMDAATFVTHAGDMLEQMLGSEARGPGDVENAMRRIEARYGVPYQAQWNARYRKPKQIAAHIYAAIAEAYDDHCASQARKLNEERARTKAAGVFACALVRAAAAVVGEGNQP